METSNKLVDALAVALDTFAKTAAVLEKTTVKVSADRTKAVNFVIDIAKKDGKTKTEIAKLINEKVFQQCLEKGYLAKASVDQYRSGLTKALAHGVAWYPKAFELAAVQEAGKKAKGRPKTAQKAVTLGTVKVDRKARTLEVKLSKSTDLDAFTAAVTAIQSEPARVALFLAYCKAQGWTE